MQRFWRVETAFFLVIWIVLLVGGRSSLLRDPGTFCHIVVGQKIIDGEGLPLSDPFSFTRGGTPWTAHQWASVSAMAAVHDFGGWDALVVLTTALLAGIYTWIASRLLRSGLAVMPTVCLLVVVLIAGSHQFHVRPLIVTLGLMGWTFAMLLDVDSGRKHAWQLWWLVPVFVVWANLHGGVLAGIGTVGLCLGGWCLLWLLRRESPAGSLLTVVNLSAIVICCCAAVFVNPYGLDLPKAWLSTLSIPLPGLIEEHAPLKLASPMTVAVGLLLLAYIAALAGTFRRGKRFHFAWLLPLVWAVLAVSRVRNVPLFAIVAALAFADVLPYSRLSGWLAGREMFRSADEEEQAGRPHWSWAALPVAILLAVVLAIQAAGVEAPVVGRGWAKLDPKLWPVELQSELDKIAAENPEGTPIFNDLNFGGYLTYHAPRMRIFIDDRCALYGGDMLLEYENARLRKPEQLEAWRQEYGFRHALVIAGSRFDKYLEESPDWQPLGRTSAAALYQYDTKP